MSKYLLCCIVALATAALPLSSFAQTTTLPSGISVIGSATAYTTDVLAEFTVWVPIQANLAQQSSADALAQARAAFARIATAEGSVARVTDMGLSANIGTGQVLENVRIAVPPEDCKGAIAAAKAAGVTTSTSTAVTIVARDPAALQAQALANATKSARAQAVAIATADRRHVGALLDVTPSAAQVARDVAASATGALGSLVAALQAHSGAPGTLVVGVSASDEAVFTFELLP